MTEPNTGITEKDGKTFIKAKMVHEFESKREPGTIIKTQVPIYNKYGVKEELNVGAGSEVVVAFTAKPYWMSKSNNGLSLRLEAVQVLKLVERGNMDAEYFGFEVCEEEPSPTDTDEEIPF